MKFNKVRYLPTGKGRGVVKLLVLFSLQALLLWTQKLFFMAIYLLSQMRYIFAACHASYAQKRYNLPCGRLRYDINPLHAPQGISHRRYIARDSVYRKSRKGFISLRSVLKGTTHTRQALFINTEWARCARSLRRTDEWYGRRRTWRRRRCSPDTCGQMPDGQRNRG